MLMRLLDTYLALRRAAGFKLQEVERHLRSFVHFATLRGDCLIKSQTALDWVVASTAMQGARIRRLRELIHFARFARAEDPRHEIPPDGVFGRRKPRTAPFIYSPEDLQRLLHAAAHWRSPGSFPAETFRTLFALLAVCGLRISEALALDLHDVTTDGLFIRNSKFRKSRWVPLHESSLQALQQYIERRKAVAGADPHLFVSPSGEPLRYSSVYDTFRELLKRTGWDAGAFPRRPRLHDFRHTFAVRALQECPQGRIQVGRHMLALSTYLGHKGVSSTYWYLQATPELMRDIADHCESFLYGGRS